MACEIMRLLVQMRPRGWLMQIPREAFNQRRLHVGRHLAPYFLLRQIDGKLSRRTVSIPTVPSFPLPRFR